MPKSEPHVKPYFDWLLEDVVGIDNDGYSKLYHEMNAIRYTYRIAMDANREGDALELRGDYEYYNHAPCDAQFQGGVVSFLEFLIAVILRVDNDLALKLSRADWMHLFIKIWICKPTRIHILMPLETHPNRYDCLSNAP